jgi:hypothetical protein
MIEDLDEIAIRTGQGLVHYSGSKRRDVGSVFCHAVFATGVLVFLDNMVGIFEYQVDKSRKSGCKYGGGNNSKIISHCHSLILQEI